MLRFAIVVSVAVTLVMPQAAWAGKEFHAAPRHRGADVVPWFFLDGATRLGVFPRWFVSYYYPYYVYGSVYPHYVDANFVVACYPIRRPALGVHGWRTRTVPACD
jgi:hypothetical protein